MNRSHTCLSEEERKKYRKIHQVIEKNIKNLAGEKSVKGFEIGSLIRRINRLYDSMSNITFHESEISGPRLAILINLYLQEDIEEREGITSSHLSRFQGVGKNTMSSLIYGLETQGFIQRENVPNDRRMHHLRLTEEGRNLVKQLVPQQMEYMNSLASELDDGEKEQLIALLTKLLHSLQMNSSFPQKTMQDFR